MNKNKKIIICIILAVIILVAIAFGIFYIINNNRKNKYNPEEIFKEYILNINNQNYEAMYEMIDEDSKKTISLDDFIARNKNIYEGIDMKDMQIEITNLEEIDKSTKEITYTSKMDSSAGQIDFTNTAQLKYDKDKGYVIKWGSNLIFPELKNEDKIRIKTISAKRGELLDRNGVNLAGTGNVSSVGIVPGKLEGSKDESIKKIASLLEISEDSINKALSASWVKDDSFVPIKKISKEKVEVKEQLLNIPGVKITTAEARVYPYGQMFAHLTGYVQTITADELKANEGKGYTSNSIIGKAGLEKQFEERLRGKNGKEIYIEDKDGDKKATIAKIEATDGEDIKLTVDYKIQSVLYNQLKDDKGFFVVMQPNTGEILALVSTPSYDVNDFVLGMTNEKWNSLKNDKNTPMLTRYLQNYCPGSTFKPITGAIGLTTNSLSIDDTFSYSGLSWQKDSSWGSYTITTLTPYSGAKNLKNAIIHSDNIYFAQAALKIGKNNFTTMLDKLKFSQNIGFELGTSKSQYSNNGTISSETMLADSGYGQGQILVNPIHMASIYSAFANEGNMIKPYLEYKDNKESEYLVEGAFTKEAANTIKEYLIEVVENPEGTANDMKISGTTIAGKTGTAELKASKNEKGKTLGWFDCFTVGKDEENSLLIIGMVEDANQNGGSHYLIKKIRSLF